MVEMSLGQGVAWGYEAWLEEFPQELPVVEAEEKEISNMAEEVKKGMAL